MNEQKYRARIRGASRADAAGRENMLSWIAREVEAAVGRESLRRNGASLPGPNQNSQRISRARSRQISPCLLAEGANRLTALRPVTGTGVAILSEPSIWNRLLDYV